MGRWTTINGFIELESSNNKKTIEDITANFPFSCGDGHFKFYEIPNDLIGCNNQKFYVDLLLADITKEHFKEIEIWFKSKLVYDMFIRIWDGGDDFIILNYKE
jgi:hypothetical protein